MNSNVSVAETSDRLTSDSDASHSSNQNVVVRLLSTVEYTSIASVVSVFHSRQWSD